jgi:hypothetical protein
LIYRNDEKRNAYFEKLKFKKYSEEFIKDLVFERDYVLEKRKLSVAFG